MNKRVKRNIHIESNSLASRLRGLRKVTYKMDQRSFAKELGVSQPVLSKWERGEYKPPPMALAAIARKDYENASWWCEQAGPQFAESLKQVQIIEQTRDELKKKGDRVVWVPLLHDALAAGFGREISEQDIDREIPFAAALMPHGGKLRALRVSGNSMAPIVEEGYVVVIDMSQQDPRKLVGQMVAAREASGVTIKWLRKDKDLYLLVPQHVSPHIPVRIMREDEDWGIVGVVLKWIGYPPASKK
jgi:SOS-response transcriptional repressor LexA